MNSIFSKTMIGLCIISCFNSCIGKSKMDDCKTGIVNARSVFNTYYKSNDSTLLDGAFRYAEQAMLCKETRLQAVEIKTSLLMLLQKYKSGYKFIDSLQYNDFNKEYKKEMNYNFFKAMEYETKGDTASAYKLYAETVNSVTQYIKTANKNNQIDQDAFYDLFLVKSKILSKEQIENEIEELIKKYPSNEDFFTTLKSSFGGNPFY